MSADNGIFYREIDGWWYVMHGFASDERADVDYVTKGIRCEDLAFCLMQAHGLAESYSVLEYGIVHDPSPQPPPDALREVAQAIVEDVEGASKLRGHPPMEAVRVIRAEHYNRLKELLAQ